MFSHQSQYLVHEAQLVWCRENNTRRFMKPKFRFKKLAGHLLNQTEISSRCFNVISLLFLSLILHKRRNNHRSQVFILQAGELI